MMKVLFVNPPAIWDKNSTEKNNFKINSFIFKPEYRKIPFFELGYKFMRLILKTGGSTRYAVRAGSRWPWAMDIPHRGPPFPFMMAYAASYLKSKGIDVNIIDSVVKEQYSYDQFITQVRKEKADIVVIECAKLTLNIDLWLAKRISKFTKVALAGPHITKETYDIISARHPEISFYLQGEYILSSYEMATTQKIGLYELNVVRDLDAIPFPFRKYDGVCEYYDPTMPTKKPQLQIYGSKGCPFKCKFCMWPQTMYKGVVSLRDPKKIAEEIEENIKEHGFKSIFFDDDTFNIGTERISKLCDYLKQIGLPWTMMGRLDCSPRWLYEKMVESGCVGMRFGIECFDLNVLKRINKGLERSDFKETLEWISNKYPKLMIHLTMMKNLPGQTKSIHEEDMRILKNMGFSPMGKYRNFQLSACRLYPGTQLYDELKGKTNEI